MSINELQRLTVVPLIATNFEEQLKNKSAINVLFFICSGILRCEVARVTMSGTTVCKYESMCRLCH